MATNALIAGGRQASTRLCFIATIFTGSFLLFLVQPMIARMALAAPRRSAGGVELGDAGLPGAAARRLCLQPLARTLRLRDGRRWCIWRCSRSPRLMLPIGLVERRRRRTPTHCCGCRGSSLVSIGPLFFVVSAQAPLMQRWFTLSGGGDPYPLYAASNLGSFGGLIVYPLVVEPLVSRRDAEPGVEHWLRLPRAARRLVRVSLAGGFGAAIRASGPPRRAPDPRHLGRCSPTIPSGLMLSTTLHITTDIMAMPLLWVLPLGLYLLSFSVAFANDRRLATWITRSVADHAADRGLRRFQRRARVRDPSRGCGAARPVLRVGRDPRRLVRPRVRIRRS